MEDEFKKYSYLHFLNSGKTYNNYLDYINLTILENKWPILNKYLDISFLLNHYNLFKISINSIDNNVDEKFRDIIQWGDAYISKNTLEQYSALFNFFIVNNISNFENSIGMDFGSGLGFSTINYSLYKPKKIYATDFRDKEVFDYYINDCKLFIKSNIEIEYIQNNSNNKLFNTNINNLDWIIAYDVLCCIPRKENDTYHSSLCNYLIYFYKILNLKGILFIGDWEQCNPNYKASKDKLQFHSHSIQSYDSDFDNGRISAPNYSHLLTQTEMCKILEIIGFKNIKLYHYGYETNQRYYILCNK